MISATSTNKLKDMEPFFDHSDVTAEVDVPSGRFCVTFVTNDDSVDAFF